MVDRLTPEQRSYCMSRIKRSDTRVERVLRSKLHRMGYRFRKNVSNMPGKPDIVFSKKKLAVFIDGDFWHGKKWASRKRKLEKGTNADYWVKKIAGNIERDRENTNELRTLGWEVLRFWESEVYTQLDDVLYTLKGALQG